MDFVLATQPKEWQKLAQHHGAAVRERFLERLASEIERRGALEVLRNGIKDSGCKAGLVLNPATPLSWLDHTLDKIDLVLVMSVNPGFGGQKFIPGALQKLRSLRRLIDDTGRDIWLEVDGGIKVENIAEVARAGADTFVAGSAIFGSKDYKATIASMRAALAQVKA